MTSFHELDFELTVLRSATKEIDHTLMQLSKRI